MKTRLLELFLLLTFVVLISGDSFAQVNWEKHQGNPVFPSGPIASWYRHVFQPCVIYNTDSLRYEMWFGAGYSYERPYQIGFATSIDGILWNVRTEGPVLTPTPGSWDSYTVEWPQIIRENDTTYKMWYSGGPLLPGSTGYATSRDGIEWTKYPDPVFEAGTADWENYAVFGCNILRDTENYKMWYTGVSTDLEFCVGYTTSTDGILWQRDTINNPVLEPGNSGQWDNSVYAPRVLFIDGIYYMWYSSNNGVIRQIGLATSTDGILNWSKHTANPVLSPSPGTWDSEAIEGGSVILVDDTLFYWYNGSGDPGGTFLWQIGLATSTPFTPVVSVIQDKTQPAEFALKQNFPNPFNPSTIISYQLPVSSDVTLKVYDLLGREVTTLVDENKQAGSYEVEFNAESLPSGVYFYQLKIVEFTSVKKMLLIK